MSARLAPGRRGLSLGLRLGLLTTLVVAGVMAALTGTQLTLELRSELRERQSRLGESLTPLVMELKTALTGEDARAAVARFHSAYADHGYAQHHLAVVDSSNRVVIGQRDESGPGRHTLLTAAIPFISAAFGTEPVVLTVTQDNTDFFAVRTRRWWAWALHVGLTALLIQVLLYIVIRREVTGPIDRLLGGVRKMERGYWDDMPDPGGAWEVRWLGWRFRALGQELNRTVEHLVAAQRRAYAVDQDAHSESDATTTETQPAIVSPVHPDPDEAIRRLQAQLECLRRTNPGDAATQLLAQITWDHHTAEAERLGQPELRMSLEDAALRVLDPDGYLDISGRFEAERPRLDALARARGTQIHHALTAWGVPIAEVCHRVKHQAGIWKKMRHKNLAFEQVYDLVALRIVVPTEADCYHALGVVHDLHAPVVGRFKDYIVGPKPNGYRGLHTCVRDPEGAIFEIQIRSIAMHRHAEQGPATHADYKDATWIPANPGHVALWKRLLGQSGGSPSRSTGDRDGSS